MLTGPPPLLPPLSPSPAPLWPPPSQPPSLTLYIPQPNPPSPASPSPAPPSPPHLPPPPPPLPPHYPPPPPQPLAWYWSSGVSESCTVTCLNAGGRTCDVATMSAVLSAASLQAISYANNFPLTSSHANNCTSYPASTISPAAPMYVPASGACYWLSPTKTSNCTYLNPNLIRLCACV